MPASPIRTGFFLSLTAFLLVGCGQRLVLDPSKDRLARDGGSCPAVLGDTALAGKAATFAGSGQVTLADQTTVSYTTTSGYLPLYASGTQSGPVKACLFFFAYTRTDHAGDPSWPVSFLSNGGPGSSSDWIHLGGMGPQVIDLGPEGISTGPTKLVDDPNTLLAISDLVFVDPINTGYSRPAQGVDPATYDGLDQEADAIGDFINGYLTKYGRTASPKYVVGESYGGMRLPVLSRYLDEKLGIKLTGLVFISPWLDAIGDDTSDMADDLPFVNAVPQFAATAWYHHKLTPDLEQKDVSEVFAEAEAYANGEYISALAQGGSLPASRAAQVAAKLGQYLGLPAGQIQNANLRITDDVFRAQILRDQGLTVSYYDGRMAAKLSDPSSQDPTDAFNPIFSAIELPYFTSGLGIQTDLSYQDNNYPAWPGQPIQVQGGYLQVLGDFQTLMENNPMLKVFMVNGYYDYVCPPGEVDYMLNHLPVDVAGRVRRALYPGGHPVYFGSLAHAAFQKDLASFYATAPGKALASAGE